MLKAHFVHEYRARKIFFQNSFHQQAPQCYNAFGGMDAFFAFPAQLFHGPPHARAAQHRAYFGKGGIGLLAQTGRKLGVARRVQARGRTTAGGQGSERIGRALMVQEFVHEGNRDAEAGGHLIHSGSRLDTHGRHPFPQINRIRFHP